MDASLQNVLSLEGQKLLEEESRLEQELRTIEEKLSGLRDIDCILSLAGTKLSPCLHLMKRMTAGRDPDVRNKREEKITEKALEALRLVDRAIRADFLLNKKRETMNGQLATVQRGTMDLEAVRGPSEGTAETYRAYVKDFTRSTHRQTIGGFAEYIAEITGIFRKLGL